MERKTGLRQLKICRSSLATSSRASVELRSGCQAAKQRGGRFVRPPKLNSDQAQVATQLLAEGKPVRDIARTFNVHKATIYRLAAVLDAV